MSSPLSGLFVLDLAQFVSGSYCTMLLGDLGADVVKVEIPGRGDPYRKQGPEFIGGEATLFLALHRSKRSVTIDWKRSEGRDVLEKLVAKADVLVQNARPGSLAKHGLDYASLSPRHPRLVYCSISGFGQTGPYAGRGGFDLILQGEGGLMSVTGEPDGRPVKVGAPVLDIGAAVSAVAGILAALRQRDATGEGGEVESSLLDFSLAALSTVTQSYFETGVDPQPLGSASPSFAPYQAVRAADGYMTIAGAGSEDMWRRFCTALGRSELLEDDRFLTNADRLRNKSQLIALIEEKLASRTVGEWLATFEEVGVPAGRINTLSTLLADPHVAKRGGIITMTHPQYGRVKTINTPIRVSSPNAPALRPSPTLGEHTDEVLQELGIPKAERIALGRSGVTG